MTASAASDLICRRRRRSCVVLKLLILCFCGVLVGTQAELLQAVQPRSEGEATDPRVVRLIQQQAQALVLS